MKRKPDPNGRAYREAALALALSCCPAIYPCANCGWPVMDGYCCQTCGSGSPEDEKTDPHEYKLGYMLGRGAG